jgi:hypothetical protein
MSEFMECYYFKVFQKLCANTYLIYTLILAVISLLQNGWEFIILQKHCTWNNFIFFMFNIFWMLQNSIIANEGKSRA